MSGAMKKGLIPWHMEMDNWGLLPTGDVVDIDFDVWTLQREITVPKLRERW